MAAVCRRTEAILAQDTEKEHGGLKDVTPGPSEVIANPALEVANATPADVPATLPFPSPARKRRRWGRIALLVLMLATAAVGSYYWWKSLQSLAAAGHRLGQRPDRGRRDRHRHQIRRTYRRTLVDEGDMVKAARSSRAWTPAISRPRSKGRGAGSTGAAALDEAQRQCPAANAAHARAAGIRPDQHLCNGATPRTNCSISVGSSSTAPRPL